MTLWSDSVRYESLICTIPGNVAVYARCLNSLKAISEKLMAAEVPSLHGKFEDIEVMSVIMYKVLVR